MRAVPVRVGIDTSSILLLPTAKKMVKLMFALAAAMLVVTPDARATDVGASIAISQSGVCCRTDIGRSQQPAVIVPQPVIIAPPPVGIVVQPVYMSVPPGHQKMWAKHCRRYSACGVQVLFVRDDWHEQNVRHSGKPERSDGFDDQGKGRGKGDG
jgi:hypothetical protein